MEYDIHKAQKELTILCNNFIAILNDYKDKGLISDEEYHKHLATKIAFLNNVNK